MALPSGDVLSKGIPTADDITTVAFHEVLQWDTYVLFGDARVADVRTDTEEIHAVIPPNEASRPSLLLQIVGAAETISTFAIVVGDSRDQHRWENQF